MEFVDVEIPVELASAVENNPFTAKMKELAESGKAAQFVVVKEDGKTVEGELARLQKLARLAARSIERTAKFVVDGDPKTADRVTVTFAAGPKITRPRKNGATAAANGNTGTDAVATVEGETPDVATEPQPEPTPEPTPEAEPTPEPVTPETPEDPQPEVPRKGGRFARAAR